MELRQARVQTEIETNTFRCDRKQIALRDREPGRISSSGIRGVSGFVQWHYHVVAVVAAGKKNTNKRSVARSLRERLNHPETVNSGGKRRDANCRTPGSKQKLST